MADAPAGQRPASERAPLRCDSCLQFDTHPRHTVVEQLDPVVVVSKHWDCCRSDGCPSGHCDEALLAAHGARGETLTAWVHAEMAAGRR